MGFVIRPFRETDRAAVITFTVAAFPGVSIDHNVDERLGAVAGRDWQWRKGRDVERDIDSPGTELAIAEDAENGATVGYVTMAFDPETRIGWIHNLAVHADLRGQGLGRRLIEHTLDRFRGRGNDRGQDRDTRAESDRPAALFVTRLPGGRPPDSFCHAPFSSSSGRFPAPR